jgi:uncharacterized DUF497 family protein
MIELEWDDAKRVANLRKHGVDFADMEEFGWDTALYDSDENAEYGEDRYVALGLFRANVYVVVFTLRGNATRIISARKADKREMRRYEKEAL